MKNIFITGGNRGIGLETARQLSNQGHTVFLSARNDKAVKVTKTLRSNVIPIDLDVSDSRSTRTVAEQVSHHTSNIDVLINNAGNNNNISPTRLHSH